MMTMVATTKTAEKAFDELAQVIKGVLDEAAQSLNKENNLTDNALRKHCAFCGKPKYDIVLPRGRTSLLVCFECYKGAKAILDTNHKPRE